MQAVILAAGCGSRLAPVLNGKPKCLIQVDGVTLIEYQLRVLRSFGITDVCVVLGYRADQVHRAIAPHCHSILNHRYAQTNSLYSLSLTRDWVRGSFLLMNSDVLAHPLVYQRLLTAPGSALAYDSSSGTEAEHMKVGLVDGRLQQISKTLPIDHSQGESIGLLKFTAQDTAQFFWDVKAALSQGGENQWAPAAVERLAGTRPITGVDIASLPWVEIDFPQDWLQACEQVWPRLYSAVSALQLNCPLPEPLTASPVIAYGEAA
ncbi:MAG: phosphocholine cytidylyltransferase family protein [Leptolyngbyaceae cyanobacterium MO_188.B28]|nr:phosphocholine cytidylyltransferase family protein [Leptolyngbyaceae cyanobacterium MO_188.B28]